MPAPSAIIELVNRFGRNYDSYKSPHYNETQVRREFVDPMFKALGWDIDNAQGYAEAYKDVIHEDAMRIEGAPRSPDYGFRIGGVRKFFVETKKPSVSLRDDATSAFQLRRYAWSAKLPVSILTDFEEFVVYDTTKQPSIGDNASVARIDYLRYDQFVEHWDERLASRFSRDAVLKGDFDRYVAPTARRSGTVEVDDAFLEEMEKWRELLAKNIALRNTLDVDALNFAVQMTMDRIVFLRIAEDRGLEEMGNLQNAASAADVYPALLELFRKADARYNSGLFHFKREQARASTPDDLTTTLVIDDKPLKDIIRRLYYPDSPYAFALIPSEILGQVYERFLGKVIRLQGDHRAIVELKPEVRKAGGVYYTPTFIVNHIVERCVGEYLQGKKPRPATKSKAPLLRVLDPACGSGSFLLGAYDFLLRWHRDWYVNDDPKAWAKRRNPTLVEIRKGDWRLTTRERKRILTESIFGVDIDRQAVEVTKLSLLLKVLEGESQQTLQRELNILRERALPDLDDNIKRGNSLIGADYYSLVGNASETDLLGVHPFDWAVEFPKVFTGAGGFDVVVGNPPYDVLEKERGKASWPHNALTDYKQFRPDYAPALGGKLNLFRFFVVRALALTKSKGRFGMIVPLAIIADITSARTRKHVLLSLTDLRADCFPQKDNASRRVFKDAKLSTVVLTGQRAAISAASAQVRLRVYPWNSMHDVPKEATIRMKDAAVIDPESIPIPLVGEDEWALLRKVQTGSRVVRFEKLHGVEITRGEINQTVFREFITSDPTDVRLVKGVEVGPFFMRSTRSQGVQEWFNEMGYLRANNRKKNVHVRRIATQRITGVDERRRLVAAIVEPPAYFADSTNSITSQGLAFATLEYLAGLLNTTLFQWRFRVTSTNNNVGTNELGSLPIRQLSADDPDELLAHDRIVAFVVKLADLRSRLEVASGNQREPLLRQIGALERDLNATAYELYGLTAADVTLIERLENQPRSAALTDAADV